MARPKIVGNIIRCIDMRCTVNGKNKGYRITIAQNTSTALCRIYIEYGSGAALRDGKEYTSAEINESEAHRQAEKIRDLKNKQADSYSVTFDQAFPPCAEPAIDPSFVSRPAAPLRKLISASTLSATSLASLAAIF